MSNILLSQFITFPTSLLLGVWLALISHFNPPAQAKTIFSNVLIAQAVVEPLPPPPQTRYVPNSQQSLPHLQPDTPQSVIEFKQSRPYREAPIPRYRRNDRRNYRQNYSQEFGHYLVYVNGNSAELLQQVRLIEPTAYIRQFQGRSVIQAGAFRKKYNAQQRVGQLRAYGIRTQIVSFSNQEGGLYPSSGEGGSYSSNAEGGLYPSYGEGGSYSSNAEGGLHPSYGERGSYSSNAEDYGTNQSKSSYYVAIPGNPEDLPAIESRIRESVGRNASVIVRNHPRGSHLAVGPFAQRLEAEQWNNYLRHLGFGNARVYYGR